MTDTDTMSQATKTNGIDGLPCSYVYRSSHWIGKSVGVLRPSVLVVAIEELDCPWFMSSTLTLE